MIYKISKIPNDTEDNTIDLIISSGFDDQISYIQNIMYDYNHDYTEYKWEPTRIAGLRIIYRRNYKFTLLCYYIITGKNDKVLSIIKNAREIVAIDSCMIAALATNNLKIYLSLLSELTRKERENFKNYYIKDHLNVIIARGDIGFATKIFPHIPFTLLFSSLFMNKVFMSYNIDLIQTFYDNVSMNDINKYDLLHIMDNIIRDTPTKTLNQKDRVDIVNFLYVLGCDIYYINDNGESFLDIAEKSGYNAIADFLYNLGVRNNL